jgi:hypothetical protein
MCPVLIDVSGTSQMSDRLTLHDSGQTVWRLLSYSRILPESTKLFAMKYSCTCSRQHPYAMATTTVGEAAYDPCRTGMRSLQGMRAGRIAIVHKLFDFRQSGGVGDRRRQQHNVLDDLSFL